MSDLKGSRFRPALLLLLLTLSQASIASEDFAIVNINVIPMDEERLLENQVVVVSGGLFGIPTSSSATSPGASRPSCISVARVNPGRRSFATARRFETDRASGRRSTRPIASWTAILFVVVAVGLVDVLVLAK